jgi:hypothetical protein
VIVGVVEEEEEVEVEERMELEEAVEELVIMQAETESVALFPKSITHGGGEWPASPLARL